ncbi:MAG TPA: DUF5107 domain-containing protein [Bryobacteraceae bacterium]|nr:DUF5107 domain-containing protein [Bryobacteraceae bacterium]
MHPTTESVRAWDETVIIPTYPAPAPDRNPMFLEKRVYQGSSGKVYPSPFTDRVSDHKVDKSYQAVFLENEFVRLMILPELGGRIHIGFDKTRNYDFIYRQNVIKPALVGLLGPWISGGIEFNWPQHHRPSTFMPVEHHIEEHADGSRTVWLSEHEPMNRMKGMVGICLSPGKSLIEAKVRLYNRTPLVQTFLWWANLAVRVHDQYQAFFPPDVTYVADHARRAVSSFPIARNFYYGVDYTRGVDIRWYRNIPVPTSYMVTASHYDFFGGYDHERRAGVVHVADHHIAPGKKLWTWGNHEFGYAWDRELTDSGGPYCELMAGVFTDNQPDFSFLHPYETRAFSQFWYPIQEIGPAHNANRHMAVSLETEGGRVKVGVCAAESCPGARILLTAAGEPALDASFNLSPGRPFVEEQRLPRAYAATELLLQVFSHSGEEMIRYRPEEPSAAPPPDPAREPAPPREIASNEDLYLTGLHLQQYRHATRHPEDYWTEGLRRDPLDSRANNAMGLLALRSGRFTDAEEHFRSAIERLTRLNQNPYDGEPHYHLGLSLRWQERFEEAYAAFYKSAWNYAWQSAAYYQLALLECRRSAWQRALEHVDRSLDANPTHLKARNLKTAMQRRLLRKKEAAAFARQTGTLDALDYWSRNERVLLAGATQSKALDRELFEFLGTNPQTCLDIAFDYADAGLWREAAGLLKRAAAHGIAHPMICYALGFFSQKLGDEAHAREFYRQGAAMNPDWCFPSRLEEMRVLKAACRANPGDARAHYYLGNLLYDKRRYEEAIEHWERSTALDSGFSIPWRNLGIAAFNVQHNAARARECYQQAFEANPEDARLLYELDQLEKRTGADPSTRLALLEQHRDLVAQRDDLVVELATLYNQTGSPFNALTQIENRRFHPWEGGEGLVSGQFVLAHFLLGRRALAEEHFEEAAAHFESARHYPENLGEGKHLLTPEAHLHYYAGVALAALGRTQEAEDHWRAASERNDAGPAAYYRALALRKLGREEEAASALRELQASATRNMAEPARIEYFATSLPNFLLFDDDLELRKQVGASFLCALAQLGLGQSGQAAVLREEVLRLDPNHIWAQIELPALPKNA